MYIILFAQSYGGTGGHTSDLIYPDVRILVKSAFKLPLILLNELLPVVVNPYNNLILGFLYLYLYVTQFQISNQYYSTGI
jgi:hypothetical protein